MVLVRNSNASVEGESRGGRSTPFGQHDEASAESSAGRTRGLDQRSSDFPTSELDPGYPPEGTDAALSRTGASSGGDRRIAGRKARGKRVSVRLSDEESAQLARVCGRYRVGAAGAIRAGIDMLDGAPAPKVVDRELLCFVAAVNAVGVNVNQLARQGWKDVAPDISELRRATDQLLGIAKELA